MTDSPTPSAPSTPLPQRSGIQSSTLALVLTSLLLAVTLALTLPLVIDYSRYQIPEELEKLIGKNGLDAEQTEKLTAALRAYEVLPTRTFFPICGLIVVSVFALIEAISWRKNTMLLLALIVGPVIGLSIGYAAAELTMLYFYGSGNKVNPGPIEGLSMQAISLGLLGCGTGLAMGIIARSAITAVTASIAGVMSGFIASCIFVIFISVVFPLQDVYYPIPGFKLTETADYATTLVWSVTLPICLGLALTAARKKTLPPIPPTAPITSEEKSAT